MRKFKIPSIPPTTNKCIRIPNDLIAGVEKAIQGRDCTFSAFVIEAIRVALENLEEESDDQPNKKWAGEKEFLFSSPLKTSYVP